MPTIDVLATVHGSPHFRAVAFAVKPDPNEQNLSEWDATKLAIQNGYCDELGISWFLISAENIPETLSENLKILLSYSGQKPELGELLSKFSNLLNPRLLNGEQISNCITTAARKLSLTKEMSNELFHRALWFKTIPIDLREPWVLGEPAHLCDGQWVETTRKYLLGGRQEWQMTL